MSLVESVNNKILIAKALSPYAVRGYFKIRLYCEFETAHALDAWLWVSADHKTQRWLRVEDLKLPHPNAVPLVKMKEINQPEDAKTLSGGLFYVDAAQMPIIDEDSFYWKDLCGCVVTNKEGETLGHVLAVNENIANAFLEVGNNVVNAVTPISTDPTKKTKPPKIYAIPFVNEYLIDINIPDKKILVDWNKDWF